jgi:UDP-glucose 4-epimerase
MYIVVANFLMDDVPLALCNTIKEAKVLQKDFESMSADTILAAAHQVELSRDLSEPCMYYEENSGNLVPIITIYKMEVR